MGAIIHSLDGQAIRVQSMEQEAQRQDTYNFEVADFHTYFVGQNGVWVHNVCGNGAKGLIGKEFEEYLMKSLGGVGSFKNGGREFDGAIGNRWYEAKSGRYWEDHVQIGTGFDKFKSDMGNRKSIAEKNGATYELFSNTPIPYHAKDWLNKKGINFTEY